MAALIESQSKPEWVQKRLSSLAIAACATGVVAVIRAVALILAGLYFRLVDLHGPSEPAERGGVLSFTFDDIHPHDLTQVFDQHGVCVRAGHHCAKPLMRTMGVAATARASLYVYNDESDVDALAEALQSASDFFAI